MDTIYDPLLKALEAQTRGDAAAAARISEIVLKSITFHPVDSSAEGFRRAARAATEAAFSA